MPYANVEDRRRRARERWAERPDIREASLRQARARMGDPEYRAKRNRDAVEWKRRQRAWIDALKIERGCADCGYNDHPVALDFDHIDGKTFSIGAGRRSKRAVLEEIARCEVVCANCHRLRTERRRRSAIS